MDWNRGINVEAETHFPATDFKHDHLEQVLEAAGSSDHNRFLAFPR